MSRPPVIAVLFVLALAASGCGGNGEEEPRTRATATPAAPKADEAGCEKVARPRPKRVRGLRKPTLRLERGKRYVAEVLTSCGELEITLDSRRAPRTGGSFVHLARKGFYDGTTFHRIVPGFVIQGGDPAGDGTGGPGYSVIEPPPENLQYTRGVVAMAKTAAERPGTSGSQFFVVTGEDAGLPPQYALLGRVTRGQDVVDTIGTVATDANTEQPTDPVVIRQVRIVER